MGCTAGYTLEDLLVVLSLELLWDLATAFECYWSCTCALRLRWQCLLHLLDWCCQERVQLYLVSSVFILQSLLP